MVPTQLNFFLFENVIHVVYVATIDSGASYMYLLLVSRVCTHTQEVVRDALLRGCMPLAQAYLLHRKTGPVRKQDQVYLSIHITHTETVYVLHEKVMIWHIIC